MTVSASAQALSPIQLFGASTPSGAAFRALAAGRELRLLGRHRPADLGEDQIGRAHV